MTVIRMRLVPRVPKQRCSPGGPRRSTFRRAGARWHGRQRPRRRRCADQEDAQLPENSMAMKNFAGAILKAAIAVFLSAATVSFGGQGLPAISDEMLKQACTALHVDVQTGRGGSISSSGPGGGIGGEGGGG